MDEHGRPTYRYLNRDNQWLDFQWWNLEQNEDGSLRLASVPLFAGVVAPEIMRLPSPVGVAGVTVTPDGNLYYTDPQGHRIWRVEPCFNENRPVHCFSGLGSLPGQCRVPRGLAWHALRNALIVADSGNHRIQLLSPEDMQVIGIWGQADPFGTPRPGAAAGELNTPTSLAADPEGNVFVVDSGNQRVERFDPEGNVVPGFWHNVSQSAPGLAPSEVAAVGVRDAIEVFILEVATSRLWVFDREGMLIRSSGNPSFNGAMGLTVAGDELYIGNENPRRVLRFHADGELVGPARGYAGPVAALCTDETFLYVHSGGAYPPVRLVRRGAYSERGIIRGGPFENASPRVAPLKSDGRSERLVMLHRLRCFFASLRGDAHVQLYCYTSLDASVPPPDPLTAPGHVFDTTQWNRLGVLDSLEGMFSGNPKDLTWIGIEFAGGAETPVLPNIRLDFDHQSLLEYVPAIYKERKAQPPAASDNGNEDLRWFLLRFLSLFESPFADIDREIAKLTWIFDPQAIPGKYLGWLADTVGVELEESWTDGKKREAIANGFAMHAKRGTPAGLKDFVKFSTGADVHIEEPITRAAWWSLPGGPDLARRENQNSILGVTTMLAAAEPQGAVLGMTAVLDHSHLIGDEDYGAPLFSDLAHRFLVQVDRGEVRCRERLEALRAVIEQEKPAHTAYHLCVIEPRMRVGFQSRLGIDAIVASALTGEGRSVVQGAESGLAGAPSGRIGAASKVGQNTRLGDGATA